MSRNSGLSSTYMPRVVILAGRAILDPHIISMEKTIQEVDARDLQCPMPLLKAKRALNGMAVGERLRVLATDGGSVRDFEVFAQQSGHQLLSSDEREGVYIHVLEKV